MIDKAQVSCGAVPGLNYSKSRIFLFIGSFYLQKDLALYRQILS